MSGLTPSERRGARMLAIVIAIGTLSDLHRARTVARAPEPERVVSAPSVTDSAARLPGRPPPGASAPRPLDLDSASVADLDRLPGIGPVLAARIVEHRRIHG